VGCKHSSGDTLARRKIRDMKNEIRLKIYQELADTILQKHENQWSKNTEAEVNKFEKAYNDVDKLEKLLTRKK
jgi:hypothetical protein